MTAISDLNQPEEFLDYLMNLSTIVDLTTIPLQLKVKVTKGIYKGTIGKFVEFTEKDYMTPYLSINYLLCNKRTMAFFNNKQDLKNNWKTAIDPRNLYGTSLHNRYNICIKIGEKKISVSWNNCEWDWTTSDFGVVLCSSYKPKEKPVLPIPDVYDSLGTKIEVGNLCSYILYHHRYTGARIYYGTVTKINHNGNVFCTDINVGNWPNNGKDQQPKEKKVLETGMITILNEELMDRLLMARLGS